MRVSLKAAGQVSVAVSSPSIYLALKREGREGRVGEMGVREKDLENVSNSSRGGGSQPWTLGARSLKKKVKAARRAGWGSGWKGCRKQPPQGAIFCHRYLDSIRGYWPHLTIILPVTSRIYPLSFSGVLTLAADEQRASP